MSELEQLRKEADELHTKRERLEKRHTELLDRIAAIRAGKPQLPPLPMNSIFRATREVQNVLDVSRAERVTLQPGMIVASMSVNAARFSGQRVVFCSDEILAKLLEDNAITPTT